MFEDKILDIPCPECRHKNKVSIGKLKNSPRITCRGCRKNIQINASEFKKYFDDFDRQLKQIKNITLNL